jgi:hypothetical protein
VAKRREGLKVALYTDPETADRELYRHYASMTPQERLDELAGLLDRWCKWNERPCTRVARILTVPPR